MNTPFQAYLYAQRVAQREAQLLGTSSIMPAQRIGGGWWTPFFPAVYLPVAKNLLPAPRAHRHG